MRTSTIEQQLCTHRTSRSRSRSRTPSRSPSGPAWCRRSRPRRCTVPTFRVLALLQVIAFLIPLNAVHDQLRAQAIPIKTVPVATGDQFFVNPSDRPGMGGANLAVRDTLGDSFRNPALGVRLPGSLFYGAPILYGISGDNGSGRTLPLGALVRSDAWYGSARIALQQLAAADRGRPIFCNVCDWNGGSQLLSERSARNLYLFGAAGREFGDGLAVGVSASYADLRWISGIEHLYAGSERIVPRGHTSGLRLGAVKSWPDGRELDFVLFRNKVEMEHEVFWVDFLARPNPGLPDDLFPQETTLRREMNLDHTNTVGGEVRYTTRIEGSPWNVTTAATLNRADHPKIPNYQIQDIPRDPGETWALGFALGAARTVDDVTYTVEAVYQPIWSDTWQEADQPDTTASGRAIPKGGRTIENEFRFDNVQLRTGIDSDFDWGDVQVGLEARSIQYTLDQVDWLEETSRTQDEAWIEWSPTASVGLELNGLSLRYFGKRTSGVGQPGVDRIWGRLEGDASTAAPGIIAAPSGPLTLQNAAVWTHQFVVTVPLN